MNVERWAISRDIILINTVLFWNSRSCMTDWSAREEGCSKFQFAAAIVADEKKAQATLAALRGGLINSLITNSVVATKMIELDNDENGLDYCSE